MSTDYLSRLQEKTRIEGTAQTAKTSLRSLCSSPVAHKNLLPPDQWSASGSADAFDWWLIHFGDSKPMVMTCSPGATRAEVLAWYAPAGATDAEPYAREIRRPAAPLTNADEAAVLAWLAGIGDTDPVSIADIIGACQRDADARCYFIGLAREARP